MGAGWVDGGCMQCLPMAGQTPLPTAAAAPAAGWLQVKGLLLESEVELAKKEYYLKGAHVVVGERSGLGWQGQTLHLD